MSAVELFTIMSYIPSSGLEDRAQKLHDEKTGRKRWRPEIDENERRASETASESIDAIGGRKEGKKEEDGRYNMQCLPSYLPASLTDWLFGSRTQEGKASTLHMHVRITYPEPHMDNTIFAVSY